MIRRWRQLFPARTEITHRDFRCGGRSSKNSAAVDETNKDQMLAGLGGTSQLSPSNPQLQKHRYFIRSVYLVGSSLPKNSRATSTVDSHVDPDGDRLQSIGDCEFVSEIPGGVGGAGASATKG